MPEHQRSGGMPVHQKLEDHRTARTRPPPAGDAQHLPRHRLPARRMVHVDHPPRRRIDPAHEAEADVRMQDLTAGLPRDQGFPVQRKPSHPVPQPHARTAGYHGGFWMPKSALHSASITYSPSGPTSSMPGRSGRGATSLVIGTGDGTLSKLTKSRDVKTA